jgi:hypothetical protein
MQGLRRLIVLVPIVAICLFCAGCGGKDNPVVPEDGIVLSEGSLDAEGRVQLEFEGTGTVSVGVRNGLTGEPLTEGVVLAVASTDEDIIVCAVFPDDMSQMPPGFYSMNRSGALEAEREGQRSWFDIFPWIGGDSPVTGVHSVDEIPRWAWEELVCYTSSHGVDTIAHMHLGVIESGLEGIAIGIGVGAACGIIAVAFPPAAPAAGAVVVIAKVVGFHNTMMEALQEVQLLVYGAQGYCLDQEVELKKLWGFCDGAFALGVPLITPVDEDPLCGSETTGRVYGYVTDASSGDGIPGANVYVNGVADYTSTNGYYSVEDVLAGNAVPVMASCAGFSLFATDVVVPSGGSVRRDITLVPQASSNEYRFILTWGENPADLDSHLWVPVTGSDYTHIYWCFRGSLIAAPYAQLDVDDVTSYGPETVTVLPQYGGTYEYAVHEYSGSGTLATSDAIVRIYRGDSLIHTLTVPTGSCGDRWWWHVASFNPQTGSLAIVDELQEPPPVRAGGPSVRKG